MIKTFIAIMTLFNVETKEVEINAILVESTYDACIEGTIMAGKKVIDDGANYDTILVKCIEVEKL